MNKKIYKAVSDRADNKCEVCGGYFGEYLQLHHIIGGRGKRQQCETVESCIMVDKKCHDEIHSNRELDLQLKIRLQNTYFEKGYTEEKIRNLMGGRIYCIRLR